MKKTFAVAVVLASTLPLFASSALFSSYEAARAGLLRSSLQDVQSAAKALATEATKTKNAAVAKQANAVAASADLDSARIAFTALSDEMIKVRATAKGATPAVYHCSMVKKSWLQPKGKVGNPYEPAMAMCGELKAE